MPRRRQPEPPIYTFRVRILGGYYAPTRATEIWREIEVAANQTLADLGNAIPLAFDFDDPHLWSFFFSGKAWDRATEYALHSEANLLGSTSAILAPRLSEAHQIRRRPGSDVPVGSFFAVMWVAMAAKFAAPRYLDLVGPIRNGGSRG